MVNGMIENRELTMDDYLAMLRRRLTVILIPALLAPLAGFLVSYAFPAKYTSQSLVLVEGQRVPDNYVKPVITSDFTQRIGTLQQQVLSATHLRPMLERLGITRAEEQSKLIGEIQSNLTVHPVITAISSAPGTAGIAAIISRPYATIAPLRGF